MALRIRSAMGREAWGLPFRLTNLGSSDKASLAVDGQTYSLKLGEYTPWIKLRFRGGPGLSVCGIARFLLTEFEPDVSLYVTPIQIDPEHPALPISHPSYYAPYLAKLIGSFATLGMAEDTSASPSGALGRA